MKGASSSITARAKMPSTATASAPWRMTFRARAWSSAPTALATWTEYPTPTPAIMPLMSQMEEATTDTPAVALAPREPTMAVSAKDTVMPSSCSKIAGQVRCHSRGRRRCRAREDGSVIVFLLSHASLGKRRKTKGFAFGNEFSKNHFFYMRQRKRLGFA